LSNISGFYTDANIEIKRKLLGSIFPAQLFFSKEKSRTPRVNEAVRLILSASKGFSQQKTGQLFKNLTLSGEVDSTSNLSNHKEVDCVHRSPKENPPSLRLRMAKVETGGQKSNRFQADLQSLASLTCERGTR